MENSSNKYRQIGTIAVAICIYFVLMTVVDQIGLPTIFADALTAILLLLFVIVPTLRGGAIRSGKFFFADREITTGTNALSIVAISVAPCFIVASGYLFFNMPALLVSISVVICTALAIFTLLIGKPFRQSGATSLSNFHRYKYENSFTARTTALVTLIAGLLLFLAGLYYAIEIATWFFGFKKDLIAGLFCFLVILVSSIGGVSSLTRQAAVAMGVLLLALNLPLALISISQDSLPVGILTFANSAIEPFFNIENQLRERNLPLIGDSSTAISDTINWTASNWNMAIILMLLGLLTKPNLMQQFSANKTSLDSSVSGEKSILIVGFFFLTIFALLAYSKLALYETFLGLTSGEVRQSADLLFKAAPGLISICGEFIKSPGEAISACGGNPNYIIELSDIAINGNLILAANTMLMGFPYGLTGFAIVGLLSVLIAYCSATLLAASNNLISAFYSTDDKQLASVELFLTRLTVVLIAPTTTYLFYDANIDPIKLTIFAFSIYAVCVTPSTLALFLWKRTSRHAVAASTGISFFVMIVLWILTYLGMDFSIETDENLVLSLPYIGEVDPVNVGVIVLPLSILLLITISVWSPFKPKPLKSAIDKEFEEAIFDDGEEVVIAKNSV